MQLIGNRTVFKSILKIIIWQIMLVLCIGFILGWVFTVKTGISFTLGGAISIFPGILFAKIFLKTATDQVAKAEDQTAKKVLSSFFYGETVKWLVTLVLFILAFQWKGLQMLPLFLGIMVAQLAYWIALI